MPETEYATPSQIKLLVEKGVSLEIAQQMKKSVAQLEINNRISRERSKRGKSSCSHLRQ
jgi:hypothetical protein